MGDDVGNMERYGRLELHGKVGGGGGGGEGDKY